MDGGISAVTADPGLGQGSPSSDSQRIPLRRTHFLPFHGREVEAQGVEELAQSFKEHCQETSLLSQESGHQG